jgi:hypothetical protein
MTRLVARHVALGFLPLVMGIGAGWLFAAQQPSCGSLVGPLFAAKCGRMLVQYQLWIQTAGTAGGCFIGTVFGIWLDRRLLVRAARSAAAPPPAGS